MFRSFSCHSSFHSRKVTRGSAVWSSSFGFFSKFYLCPVKEVSSNNLIYISEYIVLVLLRKRTFILEILSENESEM